MMGRGYVALITVGERQIFLHRWAENESQATAYAHRVACRHKPCGIVQWVMPSVDYMRKFHGVEMEEAL